MRVPLRWGERTESFDFDPDSVTWSRQSGQFVVGHPTGLDGEMARVFIKKYPGKPATAHGLMASSATENRPLPSAPRLLGYAHDSAGNAHYYFTENLPKKYRLLEKLISGGQDKAALNNRLSDVLVDRNLGLKVVQAAARLFAALNRRGFAYTDFTHKNIMVDWETSDCLLIDLDSCMPVAAVPKNKAGMAGLGGEFAVLYWRAWHSWVGVFTAEMLSRSMVLSFAAVWARAAGLLRAGIDPADVQRLLRSPGEGDQAPLWLALINNDRNAFREYFALSYGTDSDSVFAQWRALFGSMTKGEAVGWPQVLTTCEATFAAVRTAAVKAPVQVTTPSVVPPRPQTKSTIVIPPAPPTLSNNLSFAESFFDPYASIGRGVYVAKAVPALAVLGAGYYNILYSATYLTVSLTIVGALLFGLFTKQRANDMLEDGELPVGVCFLYIGAILVAVIVDSYSPAPGGIIYIIMSYAAKFVIYGIFAFPLIFLYNAMKKI